MCGSVYKTVTVVLTANKVFLVKLWWLCLYHLGQCNDAGTHADQTTAIAAMDEVYQN